MAVDPSTLFCWEMNESWIVNLKDHLIPLFILELPLCSPETICVKNILKHLVCRQGKKNTTKGVSSDTLGVSGTKEEKYTNYHI